MTTRTMKAELVGMAPDRVKMLPVDDRGYPVPYFVAWVEGKPEFRVMDADKWRACVTQKLCWVCGQRLGRNLAFVIGPMCAVNRISSEPPSHLECAEFSVKACPFLLNPNMRRRENNLPEGLRDPGGSMLEHNPGVSLVWITDSYKLSPDGNGKQVIRFAAPKLVKWFREGRAATRAEVESAIDFGVGKLYAHHPDATEQEKHEFESQRAKISPLLPLA
jgi:hypothetical protein